LTFERLRKDGITSKILPEESAVNLARAFVAQSKQHMPRKRGKNTRAHNAFYLSPTHLGEREIDDQEVLLGQKLDSLAGNLSSKQGEAVV
jgi:hypothetical protein